ncbi:carboxylic ester hydrolase-like [Epargyreus clarus]|uniref:carboxylic ester hydrolase-like n=1 Tax=Epargyreus clarus TaxID=520877 RepID=UPI003C2D0C18
MAIKLFLFLASVSLVSCQGPSPIVRVAQGILQGAWKQSTNGRQYASFQGVPYARPPVGKYRFREPQKLQPWGGVWDASRPLPGCLQYYPFTKEIKGSENCLYLNVATPNLDARASLPVIIAIHGGAFMYGEGIVYNPVHLMDRDVVVVTLNYRLGPLGFLSTGDQAAPGNAGLKDQAFALGWVKENIMMFGGNPDSITLTGCSAGGASVHYHYLSPWSKDTFHRGIAFSGASFTPWAHATKPLQKAKTLATIVGCPTATTREMVDCLRCRPAEVLVNAQIEMFDWKVHLFTPFVPTVEPELKNAFLTQHPFHAMLAGKMAKLPLITSITSEEGLYPAAVYQSDPSFLPELESRWEHLASNIFEYNDTLPLDLRPAVAAKIKQKYFGNKPIGQETFPQLVEALGDRHFAVDVGKLAQHHAVKSGQPTFLYRYGYRAKTSFTHTMANNEKDYGVSHADDMMMIAKVVDLSPEDIKMREVLIDMVYSYATTGVPKLPNIPQWDPIKPGSPELNYANIAGPNKVQMKASSDFGHRSFWDSLGFIENENFNIKIRDEL